MYRLQGLRGLVADVGSSPVCTTSLGTRLRHCSPPNGLEFMRKSGKWHRFQLAVIQKSPYHRMARNPGKPENDAYFQLAQNGRKFTPEWPGTLWKAGSKCHRLQLALLLRSPFSEPFKFAGNLLPNGQELRKTGKWHRFQLAVVQKSSFSEPLKFSGNVPPNGQAAQEIRKMAVQLTIAFFQFRAPKGGMVQKRRSSSKLPYIVVLEGVGGLGSISEKADSRRK